MHKKIILALSLVLCISLLGCQPSENDNTANTDDGATLTSPTESQPSSLDTSIDSANDTLMNEDKEESSPEPEKIQWIDPAFEKYFSGGLGSKGYVTESEAAEVTQLIFTAEHIQDNHLSFDDLAHFPNLKSLTVRNEPNPNLNLSLDLTGLSLAPGIEELSLANCNIYDISPLSELKNLRILLLQMNCFTDVSPIASLPALEWLSIHKNPISDISALSNLDKNVSLTISGTSISDLTPIDHIINKEILFD